MQQQAKNFIVKNRKLSLLVLIIVCTISTQTFCQNNQTPTDNNILLKGKILDVENNLPLSYTSIGILDKPLGTLSDSAGNYSFTVGKENLSDTVQISVVGYYPKKITAGELLQANEKVIRLTVKITLLDDVVITAGKRNTVIVGRQSASKLFQVSVHNKKTADETIGSEMGMKMKTRKTGATIQNFNWYLSANNFKLIKFRVNVYALKNDLPDTLISNQPIFVTIADFKTGWTKIDLTPYNIKVNGDFIITLQWVEGKMEKKENPVTIVPVAITPFSKNCYVRIASQDKWKRLGATLSCFVTLVYA